MTSSLKEHRGNSSPDIPDLYCNCLYPLDAKLTQNGRKTQLLWIVLGLLSSFFVAELTTGLWSHSVSLLADAGHLLSDIAALGLTIIATWLSQKPAANRATFGHLRVEILTALLNGFSVLILAVFIAWEAIGRFQSPEPLLGLPMLVVAGVGLAINSINIALLHKASCDSLNLRGAFLHVVADAASSVGVILAALAVYFLNWVWVDAAVSLLIACSVGFSALPLIQHSLEILMEYAPRSVDPAKVEAALNSFAMVERVEKLHIWTITSGEVALCAHIVVDSCSSQQRDRLLRQLQAHLEQNFDIRESTLQLTSRKSTEAANLHPLLNSNLIDLFAEKLYLTHKSDGH